MKESFEGLVQHFLNGNMFLGEATAILEKGLIQGALERNRGNQSATSKQLGIHRNTLQRKMVEYGLGNGRTRPRKSIARATRPRRRKQDAA